MELEPRLYVVSGELRPEQWEEVLLSLGAVGLNFERISPEESLVKTTDSKHEAVQREAIVVNRDDFIDFARRHAMPVQRANRAWNILTEQYDLQVNHHRYSHHAWYQNKKGQDLPLVYEYVPEPSDKERVFRDGLAGLRIDSLQAVLAMINKSIERYGELGGIKDVLGQEAGPAPVELMRSIVAEKLPASR